MLVDALILSIILGYFRGGSLRRLSNLEIKFSSLIFLAFLINFVLLPYLLKAGFISSSVAFWGLTFSYLLLLVVIFLNRDNKFLLVLGIGVLLNFLVILLNKGMPVSLSLTQRFAPQDYEYVKNMEGFLHIPMTDSTYLKFLGDIVPFPTLFLTPCFAVISIGDILMSLGVFLLVQKEMVYKGKHREGSQSA